MKLFLMRLLRSGISGRQEQVSSARIRRAVEAWVDQKGHRRALSGAEQIAADIGVPPEELSAYIRVRSGRSLLGWRKALRIEDAKVLLAEHAELPVATVAKTVGIDDKSNFRKQFTEETGMSPREWRERHRK